MESERMTWAELSRDDETLTIPYDGWLGVILKAAGHWPEDQLWTQPLASGEFPEGASTRSSAQFAKPPRASSSELPGELTFPPASRPV